MNDSIKVAKWEIKKNLQNKMFIIMTLVFPLFILLIGGIAGYFGAQSSSSQDMSLGVIDHTDIIYSELESNLESTRYEVELLDSVDKSNLKKVLDENELDGILEIPESIFKDNKVIVYYQDLQGMNTDLIEYSLSSVVINKRLRDSGYPTDEVLKLTRNVNFVPRSVAAEEDASVGQGIATMFMPFALAMFMVLASIFSGSALMQSIMKEKSNRIVEILFSSVSSNSLMYGKILGYGTLGLCQIILWATAGLFAATQFFDLSLKPLLEIKTLYMVIYFVLGFLLVSGLNAIAGAATRKSQSGTNTSMSNYIAIIPVVPLWLTAIIVNNPDGVFSKVLSYFPFFTPTTMLLRLGFMSPELWEVILTLAILIITDILLIKLASKAFRTGMLMYGKKITIGEILKNINVEEE